MVDTSLNKKYTAQEGGAMDFSPIPDGVYRARVKEVTPWTAKTQTIKVYQKGEDGKVLTDIDREPMEFYQALITRKMMDGDIPAMFMANNLYSEMSADGKVIRLTVYDIDKDPNLHIKKKPNFIKRLFNKMLGK